MKNKTLIIVIGILFAVSIFVFIKPKTNGYSSLDTLNEKVIFYKSITCGCCDLNANYLKSKGNFDVKISEKTEISDIKEKYGVPLELQSCHTAIIGGYFVEGHMPIEAINKLIEEKPNIKGISLPGMPSGAPGMPGVKEGDLIIYSINNDGSYQEFMRI